MNNEVFSVIFNLVLLIVVNSQTTEADTVMLHWQVLLSKLEKKKNLTEGVK